MHFCLCGREGVRCLTSTSRASRPREFSYHARSEAPECCATVSKENGSISRRYSALQGRCWRCLRDPLGIPVARAQRAARRVALSRLGARPSTWWCRRRARPRRCRSARPALRWRCETWRRRQRAGDRCSSPTARSKDSCTRPSCPQSSRAARACCTSRTSTRWSPAPRALLRGRTAGEGGDAAPARRRHEGHLPARHRARHPHRRRARGRRMGLYGEARHAVALARRPVPRLPESRQRQRQPGDGAGRHQPHVQALYRKRGTSHNQGQDYVARSRGTRWTPN